MNCSITDGPQYEEDPYDCKEEDPDEAYDRLRQDLIDDRIAPMTESAAAEQVGGGHYKDLAIQPAQYAHTNNFGYCESLCLRYITRHRTKNGRQDIEKAIHTLQLLLELEYDEEIQSKHPGAARA